MMVRTNGEGYEEVRVRADDSVHSIPHHRVLAYAWDKLDSPLFASDMREIHHRTKVRWLNTESNLTALTPREHRQRDDGRAQIRTPWDRRAEVDE